MSTDTLTSWPAILKVCKECGNPDLAATLFLKGRSSISKAELKWLAQRRKRNRDKLFKHLMPYDELIELPSDRKPPDVIAMENESERLYQEKRRELRDRFPKAGQLCLDRLASLATHGTTDRAG